MLAGDGFRRGLCPNSKVLATPFGPDFLLRNGTFLAFVPTPTLRRSIIGGVGEESVRARFLL